MQSIPVKDLNASQCDFRLITVFILHTTEFSFPSFFVRFYLCLQCSLWTLFSNCFCLFLQALTTSIKFTLLHIHNNFSAISGGINPVHLSLFSSLFLFALALFMKFFKHIWFETKELSTIVSCQPTSVPLPSVFPTSPRWKAIIIFSKTLWLYGCGLEFVNDRCFVEYGGCRRG